MLLVVLRFDTSFLVCGFVSGRPTLVSYLVYVFIKKAYNQKDH